MIMSVSLTMVTAMLNHYINFYLDMGEMGLFIMLAMLGVLGIFLVPCGIISNKIGKANTYALGLTIASIALIIVFFLPKGPNQQSLHPLTDWLVSKKNQCLALS